MAMTGTLVINTDDDQEDSDFFDQLASEFGNGDLGVLHRDFEQEDGERLDDAFSELVIGEGRSPPTSGIPPPTPPTDEDNSAGDEFWMEENLVQEISESKPIIHTDADFLSVTGSLGQSPPKATEATLISGAVQAEASPLFDATDQDGRAIENKASLLESRGSASVGEGLLLGSLHAIADAQNAVDGTVAPGMNDLPSVPPQETDELDLCRFENVERIEHPTDLNSAPVKDALVSECLDDDATGSAEASNLTHQSSVSLHREPGDLRVMQNEALAFDFADQSIRVSTSDGMPMEVVNADAGKENNPAIATPSPNVQELKWSSFGDVYNSSSHWDFYSNLGNQTEANLNQEIFTFVGGFQVDSLMKPSFSITQGASDVGGFQVDSLMKPSFSITQGASDVGVDRAVASVYGTAGNGFDETAFGNQQDVFDHGISGEAKYSAVNDAAGFGESQSVEVKQSGLGIAEGGANYSMGTTNYEAQPQDETQQNWENMYPGWYYDYASNQWRQVEGCSGVQEELPSRAEGDAAYLQTLQTGEDVGMALDPTWQTRQEQIACSVSGSNEGFVGMHAASNYQLAANDSTAEQQASWEEQYPDWYYDYQAQQWRQISDESQSWASNQDKLESSQVLASANASQTPGGGWLKPQAKPCYESEVNQNTYLPDGSQNLYSSSGDTGMNILARGMSFNSWTEPAVGFPDVSQQGIDSRKQGGSTGFWTGFPGTQSIPSDQSYQTVPNPTYKSQTDHYVADKSAFLSNSHDFFQPHTISSGVMESAHSCTGRPAHSLVTFGFGGKLVTMKTPRLGASEPIVLQDLHQLVMKAERCHENDGISYFSALNRNGLSGPLVGHGVTSKDLLRWVDEQIENCDKGDFHATSSGLRVLWGILKIACLHYGKLRSVAGSAVQVEDGPEVALGRLLMAAKSKTRWAQGSAMSLDGLQSMPTAHQLQGAADEVRNLLMDGKRKEALQLAQQGQLWGLALVLAWQLGEKVYSETVLQMAQLQFPPGSPLRTLLLLFAGQTRELFKVQSLSSLAGVQGPFFSAATSSPQDSAGGMLNDWFGNLSIIAANPTKGDEQVITHLGDSLWKDQGEVAGAHACYLVAETSFESFSKDARLCLVGADHFKYQRTFASPQAIQRTELYEYAKSLGNPQYVLVPFQPFKLLYAHMLAEAGKITEACRYCQTVAKGLKNAGRGVDIEFCKQSAIALEERLRQHSQGGYSLNLSTGRLVGKVMGTIDSTIHKIIGGPPVTSASQPSPVAFNNSQDWYGNDVKYNNAGRSAVEAAPLIPSASNSNLFSVNSQVDVPTRSVSEPNLISSIGQELYKTTTATSTETALASSTQLKSEGSGSGYLSRFGSQIFAKAIGFIKHNKEAKLGDENMFYYDENLKRWVEKGVKQTTEEAALAPPPIVAGFNSSFGTPSTDAKSGGTIQGQQADLSLPPMPPSVNQFSARGRLSGVRSRYVDTFNKDNAELAAKPSQSPIVFASGGKGMASTPTQFFASGPVPASTTYASGQVLGNGHIHDGSPEFAKLAWDNPKSEQHESMLPKNLATSFMNVPVIQKHSSASDIAMLTSKELAPDKGGTYGTHALANMARAVSWSGAASDAVVRSTHANHRLPNGNVEDVIPMEAASSGTTLPSPPVMESPALFTGDESGGVQTIAAGNMLSAYDEMQEVEL